MLLETLKNKFDKVYLLTMTNRRDRRELMEREFSEIGLPKPDSTDFIRYYFGTPFPFNGLIMNAFNASGKGRFSKPNEYDCARNHYAMVKICYDLGFDHCLILEDDILILKDTEKLCQYFDNLPDDYDVVQFGGFTTDNTIKEYTDTDDMWVKHRKVGVWTTAGYALSRRGMQYFLAFMDSVKFWVADGPLFKAPLNDKIINTYISNIPLVIQADKNVVASDIRDENNDTIDYNNQNVYEQGIDLSDYFSVD